MTGLLLWRKWKAPDSSESFRYFQLQRSAAQTTYLILFDKVRLGWSQLRRELWDSRYWTGGSWHRLLKTRLLRKPSCRSFLLKSTCEWRNNLEISFLKCVQTLNSTFYADWWNICREVDVHYFNPTWLIIKYRKLIIKLFTSHWFI